MSEYINRESIRKVLMDVCSDENCPMFIAATIDQVIDYEPAADVAPVVHAYWRDCHTQDPYCSNCGFLMTARKANMPRQQITAATAALRWTGGARNDG